MAGVYVCEEMAATWRIGPVGVRVQGPVGVGGPWEIEGIAGDIFRVWTPGILAKGWMDVRALRGADGSVAGLYVNGGRVKRLVFERVSA